MRALSPRDRSLLFLQTELSKARAFGGPRLPVAVGFRVPRVSFQRPPAPARSNVEELGTAASENVEELGTDGSERERGRALAHWVSSDICADSKHLAGQQHVALRGKCLLTQRFLNFNIGG